MYRGAYSIFGRPNSVDVDIVIGGASEVSHVLGSRLDRVDMAYLPGWLVSIAA